MADIGRLRGLTAAAKVILEDIDRAEESQRRVGEAHQKALLGQAVKSSFPDIPKTTITTGDRPSIDFQRAKEILETTPQEWVDKGLAETLKEGVEGRSGFFGLGEREQVEPIIKLKPEAEMLRKRAREIIEDPTFQRKTVSGQFAGDVFQPGRASGVQFDGGARSGISSQFTGQPQINSEIQALIDEYGTTTDPRRLKELEAILEKTGLVNFN